MPEIPLLGSLQSYTVAAAADGALLAEGPLFTANKINKNGWGIPEDEAETLGHAHAGTVRYLAIFCRGSVRSWGVMTNTPLKNIGPLQKT